MLQFRQRQKTFLQKIKCINGNKINTINATVSTGSFLYISFSMSVYIFHLQCFQVACTNRNSLHVFTLFFAHWSEHLLLLIFGGKFSNNSQCSNNVWACSWPARTNPVTAGTITPVTVRTHHHFSPNSHLTDWVGWFSEWSKRAFHIKSLLRKQITPFSTFNVKGPDSFVWVVIVIQFKIKSMWMCACNL